MDDETAAIWWSYRSAVSGVYRETGQESEFDGVEVDEATLDKIVDISNELTDRLVEQFRSPERQSTTAELETAILASAAVDAAVGADILSAFRDEIHEEAPNTDVEKALVDAIPWPRELEPIDVLLARADEAFGQALPLGGSAPDLSPPKARAQRAIDELLESGARPAISFGTGILTVGIETLVGALGGIGKIPDVAKHLAGRAKGRARKGFGLIASAIRKLLGLLPDAGKEWTIHRHVDKFVAAFDAARDKFGQRAVRAVAQVSEAEAKVNALLQEVTVEQVNAATLDAELEELCRSYAKNMRSAYTIAKRLKQGGWAIAVISGGAGHPIVAAANGVGLTYCVYGLADRLDTVPGWVPGVPAIVDRNRLSPRPE